MVSSRVLTAVLGLAVSLAVSLALYYYTGNVFVFLVVPFVPVLFRGLSADDGGADRTVRQCPRCGYRTVDPDHEYCPRDGTRLE